MTRIDFYVLDDTARGTRHSLACRLADKAWQQGHRVYLHVGSQEEARHMDALLWTFQENSFLPHGLLGEADPALNPVLIGNHTEAGDEHEILINLAPEVPQFFSRFERVLEPLGREAEIRNAGRLRYRYYRDRGYPLNSHQIRK